MLIDANSQTSNLKVFYEYLNGVLKYQKVECGALYIFNSQYFGCIAERSRQAKISVITDYDDEISGS